jgi:hypothetical protein
LLIFLPVLDFIHRKDEKVYLEQAGGEDCGIYSKMRIFTMRIQKTLGKLRVFFVPFLNFFSSKSDSN